MGTRRQLFRCEDCRERVDEEYDDNPFAHSEEFEFYAKMEHMSKEDLLEHIENIECPECGSDNWFMTDVSKI